MGRVLLPFVVLNLALLLVYRLLFLVAYVETGARDATSAVLLYGARLDAALLGATLALATLLSLLRLRVSLRSVFVVCLVVTLLNLVLCAVNFVFYGERGELVGRLLVANLSSPREVASELITFGSAHPWTAALCVVLLAAVVWLSVRLYRRIPRRTWSLLAPPWRLGLAAVLFVVFLIPVFQPIEVVGGTRVVEGWSVDLASARHYQRFDDYVVHQAIVNPLHEILFSRIPQALSSLPPPRYAPEESEAILEALLPGVSVDSAYPLLRRMPSTSDLGIENVVIVQVEGLSGSIVERVEEGRAVMPFLAELAKESLYFPNTVQTFPTTYGGMHGVTASVPRTTSCVARGRFTYEELQGYFGSLPRLLEGLGTAHSWYGSRQSAEDIRAYMGNQGYVTTGLRRLSETYAGTRPDDEIEGELGIWDGVLLEDVARTLGAGPHPVVAHAMTSSSHSPWILPPSVPLVFEDQVLSCFHYVDACLRALFTSLSETPGLLETTLVVVTADHVSFGYGRNDLDWARIPLVFANPRLVGAGLARRDARWATLTDIVPTVLALLGGSPARSYEYAGIGRNLLAPDLPFGAVFSNTEEVLYLKGDRLLRWRFADDTVGLYAADPSGWGRDDLSAEDPGRAASLTREFFGLYEATRRAVAEGRAYPRRP